MKGILDAVIFFKTLSDVKRADPALTSTFLIGKYAADLSLARADSPRRMILRPPLQEIDITLPAPYPGLKRKKSPNKSI